MPLRNVLLTKAIEDVSEWHSTGCIIFFSRLLDQGESDFNELLLESHFHSRQNLEKINKMKSNPLFFEDIQKVLIRSKLKLDANQKMEIRVTLVHVMVSAVLKPSRDPGL